MKLFKDRHKLGCENYYIALCKGGKFSCFIM